MSIRAKDTERELETMERQKEQTQKALRRSGGIDWVTWRGDAAEAHAWCDEGAAGAPQTSIHQLLVRRDHLCV